MHGELRWAGVLIRFLLLVAILVAIGHYLPQRRGSEFMAMSQSCRSGQQDCEGARETNSGGHTLPRSNDSSGDVTWMEAILLIALAAILAGAVAAWLGYNAGRSSVSPRPAPAVVTGAVNTAAATWITMPKLEIKLPPS
jgi:hypothetical protein